MSKVNYGKEWMKAMNKCPKKALLLCYQSACIDRQELQATLSLIRPLAFADHSSVEYNMEEIRKILNKIK